MTNSENLAVDGIAARIGIPIPQDYLPGVSLNFARLLDQAALVLALKLPAAPDPAPEFEP
ncbi:MAG: DUF4089 domain-containing protein [Aliidongia sp.]